MAPIQSDIDSHLTSIQAILSISNQDVDLCEDARDGATPTYTQSELQDLIDDANERSSELVSAITAAESEESLAQDKIPAFTDQLSQATTAEDTITGLGQQCATILATLDDYGETETQ